MQINTPSQAALPAGASGGAATAQPPSPSATPSYGMNRATVNAHLWAALQQGITSGLSWSTREVLTSYINAGLRPHMSAEQAASIANFVGSMVGLGLIHPLSDYALSSLRGRALPSIQQVGVDPSHATAFQNIKSLGLIGGIAVRNYFGSLAGLDRSWWNLAATGGASGAITSLASNLAARAMQPVLQKPAAFNASQQFVARSVGAFWASLAGNVATLSTIQDPYKYLMTAPPSQALFSYGTQAWTLPYFAGPPKPAVDDEPFVDALETLEGSTDDNRQAARAGEPVETDEAFVDAVESLPNGTARVVQASEAVEADETFVDAADTWPTETPQPLPRRDTASADELREIVIIRDPPRGTSGPV